MFQSNRRSLAFSFVLITVLLLSGCVGPFEAPTPTPSATTVPYHSRVVNVDPSSQAVVEVEATAGTLIVGWFVVQGENAEVDFSAEAPDGKQLITKARQSGRYDFSFPADSDGNYKLIFDNSFSNTKKDILLSYKVSPR